MKLIMTEFYIKAQDFFLLHFCFYCIICIFLYWIYLQIIVTYYFWWFGWDVSFTVSGIWIRCFPLHLFSFDYMFSNNSSLNVPHSSTQWIFSLMCLSFCSFVGESVFASALYSFAKNEVAMAVWAWGSRSVPLVAVVCACVPVLCASVFMALSCNLELGVISTGLSV